MKSEGSRAACCVQTSVGRALEPTLTFITRLPPARPADWQPELSAALKLGLWGQFSGCCSPACILST